MVNRRNQKGLSEIRLILQVIFAENTCLECSWSSKLFNLLDFEEFFENRFEISFLVWLESHMSLIHYFQRIKLSNDGCLVLEQFKEMVTLKVWMKDRAKFLRLNTEDNLKVKGWCSNSLNWSCHFKISFHLKSNELRENHEYLVLV